VVRQFKVADFIARCIELEAFEERFRSKERTFWGGRHRIRPGAMQTCISILNELKELALDAGFIQICVSTRLALDFLKVRPNADVSKVESELRRVRETVQTDIALRKFVLIAEDRAVYVDGNNLFGGEVANSFPSAAMDIQEAGNCLAVERTTAAVFHSMRAVETALRVLAKEAHLASDGPIERQQWGQIIGLLERRIEFMKKAPQTHWPSVEIKEAQVRFYTEAYIEFRSINDAWRKHVSHARADSFYSREQALSIFTHSGEFMRILARRISENDQMPEYWTTI
jgi:hypothetical protein